MGKGIFELNNKFSIDSPWKNDWVKEDFTQSNIPNQSQAADEIERGIINSEVAKTVGAKLEITTTPTGYRLGYIYGRHSSPDQKYQLKYSAIVVPTYKISLYNGSKKKIIDFDVTRDSWYSRGFKDEKPDWNPLPPYDHFELVNRHFNPKDDILNLYTAIPQGYPLGSGFDAYALSQKGKIEFSAECHNVRQNTFIDGTKVEGARADLCIAKSVMLHIGGIYENPQTGTTKLAGSEGCFGFIPKHQIFDTVEKATDELTSGNYKNWTTSNADYKKFINKIVATRGSSNNSVQILVKFRSDVEIYKDAEYE